MEEGTGERRFIRDKPPQSRRVSGFPRDEPARDLYVMWGEIPTTHKGEGFNFNVIITVIVCVCMCTHTQGPHRAVWNSEDGILLW